MIGKAVAVLLLAAAPAADKALPAIPITLPDYAAYDPAKDLAPLIRVCADDLQAKINGDDHFLERLIAASKLEPQFANRIMEICTSFDLGAAYLMKISREDREAEPSPAAQPDIVA